MPNISSPSHLADSLPAPSPRSAERQDASGRTEPWWPDWLRLRDLIEGSRIPEARVLAPELAAKWPESGTLQHYARCLEPPVVRVTPGCNTGTHQRSIEWLRTRAAEHPNAWVVLHDGEPIAVGANRDEVRKRAQAAYPGARLLLVKTGPAVDPE